MAKQIKIGPLTINQDYLTLILLAFLIIGLFITTLIVKQRQEIRSKAVDQGKVGLLLKAIDNITSKNTITKVTPGMEFTVRVKYDPNLTDKIATVSGIETHIAYPTDVIEIVDNPRINSASFPTILQNKVSEGRIDLSAGIAMTTPTRPPTATPIPTPITYRFTRPVFAEDANPDLEAGDGTLIFATINFRVKVVLPADKNTVDIQFTENPPQIVTISETANNAVDKKSITNLSLLIERTTGTQPNITFKIKFRSVNGDVGDQKVTIKTKKGNEVKEFKNITVKHGENGIYKADNVPLTGLAAGTYKIYVKGPKHLAKSFGEVELINGTNTFGWAQAELEPGDTAPQQDGIINSQDISRIIERLEVADPSADDLLTADLNYDKVINGADINELIVTLGTKFDEDKY